jgi:hypothetical protein
VGAEETSVLAGEEGLLDGDGIAGVSLLVASVGTRMGLSVLIDLQLGKKEWEGGQ